MKKCSRDRLERCREEYFAYVIESLGVTSQSKREVRAEEREPQCWWRIFDGSPCCMIPHSSPPFLDAGIYIKKKSTTIRVGTGGQKDS